MLVHQPFDVKCELLGFRMSIFLISNSQELISKSELIILSEISSSKFPVILLTQVPILDT